MVTTGTRRYVADVLVSYTRRNERTQGVAQVTEVVGGIQGSQVALDVLAAGIVFRANVVVLAVGQAQGNVISQVVADGTAKQVAFGQVTAAVGEIAFGESVNLDSALALSQRAHGGSGNQRANDEVQGVFQFHPLNPQ